VGDVLMMWHTAWNIFKYLTFPFNVFCTVLLTRFLQKQQLISEFYVLLTVHLDIIV